MIESLNRKKIQLSIFNVIMEQYQVRNSESYRERNTRHTKNQIGSNSFTKRETDIETVTVTGRNGD